MFLVFDKVVQYQKRKKKKLGNQSQVNFNAFARNVKIKLINFIKSKGKWERKQYDLGIIHQRVEHKSCKLVLYAFHIFWTIFWYVITFASESNDQDCAACYYRCFYLGSKTIS